MRLALCGELDVATVAEVQAVLSDAEADAPALIVLDLRGLTFMDMTGLQFLLRTHERRAHEGLRLLVLPGCRAVRRVLEISGVVALLPLLESPEPRSEDGCVY